jgi:MORN repeat
MSMPASQQPQGASFYPIWYVTPNQATARLTCRADLLATVLSGLIEPPTQVRDDNSNVWTSACDHPLVAPLLACPGRAKRSRWLLLLLSVVLGAVMIVPLLGSGFHGWRTMVSGVFIYLGLQAAYRGSVAAVDLSVPRQLLLYVAGISLMLLGFGACDALIELVRLAFFPELPPDSNWLAIPLFIGIVLAYTAVSALLWERWEPCRRQNLLKTLPDDHPIKARTAQIQAKQARFHGLLGLDGCIRHAWPDGERYEGKLKDKQREGFGVFTWPNGVRHEGEWRQGKQHGYGVAVAADGSETAGRWQNGERVSDKN